MKNFLKNLIITAVSIFAIVSFVTLDINVTNWGNGGRICFVFFTLLITSVSTAIQESTN